MPEPTRTASCACGDFRVDLAGDPLLVSACCCTRCQHRTGSFLAITAIFRPGQMVAHHGTPSSFHRPDGATTFFFCPTCGTTLWFRPDDPADEVIGVAAGAFADPTFPGPTRLIHTRQAHPFIAGLDAAVVHRDAP